MSSRIDKTIHLMIKNPNYKRQIVNKIIEGIKEDIGIPGIILTPIRDQLLQLTTIKSMKEAIIKYTCPVENCQHLDCKACWGEEWEE